MFAARISRSSFQNATCIPLARRFFASSSGGSSSIPPSQNGPTQKKKVPDQPFPPPLQFPSPSPSTSKAHKPSEESQSKSEKRKGPTGEQVVSYLFLVTMSVGFGYGLGSMFPSDMVSMLRLPKAPPSPPIDSEEGIKMMEDVEMELQKLPIVQEYKEKVEKENWHEGRPHQNTEKDRAMHNLTGGTLRGPGKLAIAPMLFSSPDDKEAVIIIHVGQSVCGHDGIIHGGLLATLLDEGLAFPSIFALPSKVGVTAYLNLNYKAPAKADQFLVMRTEVTEVKGRKAFAKGCIETLDGKILADATSLYVEPKLARMLLNPQTVRSAMGR